MKTVFVFGSNLAGHHGAGAAKFAYAFRGAIMGKGEGEHGNSYALPTKDENIRTLPLVDIKKHIDTFIDHASNNVLTTYEITKIGCGLAGYSWVKDILPLFPSELPCNCFFIDDNGKRTNG